MIRSGSRKPSFVSTLARIAFSAALLLIGGVLIAGGARLMWVGGSRYFTLAGLGFMIAAALIYRANRWSYWSFALLILATLLWAVLEVGFDWWQLFPRGNVI